MIPLRLISNQPLVVSNQALVEPLEQRLDTFSISDRSPDGLRKNCSELSEFLQRAITFLKSDDNGRFNEQVAHYLMGKIDYLPEGLAAQNTEISREVKSELYDLLRTHRHGIFGKHETPEKTIAKLTALDNYVFSNSGYWFACALDEWVRAVSGEGRLHRQVARTAIMTCINQKRGDLSLADLDLTTIPPLPADLVRLNLSGNRFTSLAGMPSQMNALEDLSLVDNHFTSLDWMPSQMSALKRVNLNRNNLTSLDGMPPEITRRPDAHIFLRENPLSPDTINAISNRAYQAQIFFDMAAHDAGQPAEQWLDEEVNKWFPNEDANAWKAHAETREGKSLATLLMRLHGCASFKGSERVSSVDELGQILARMRADESFQTYCFNAVQGSYADCHDNGQAIFDSLRMEFAKPAMQGGATLTQVVAFQRGRLAAQLIDAYVATLNSGGDPLESGMLLKKELSQELNLPIQFRKIHYAGAGVVSNNIQYHKAQVKTFITSHLTSERLSGEMVGDVTCVDFLEKTYPATFNAHYALWVHALDQAMANNKPGAVTDGGSELQQARELQYGDGREFKERKEAADKELHTKIAMHAHLDPRMTPEERGQWEIAQLLKNTDWVGYLKDLHTEKQNPIIPSREQLVKWTNETLNK